MKLLTLSIIALVVMFSSCNTNNEDTEMKEKGEAFLSEMEKKDGVVKTASGLLYEVIVEGSGDNPLPSNTVKVNYTGKFIDEKVFDSTEGKSPIEFGLTQVISGWTEGLQLMNRGAKYRFYIPYQLGYGPQGYPGAIPPFSALIFDVELIDYK